MINTEINPHKIMSEARNLQYLFKIALSEFDFIFGSSLSEREKLLWLLIARYSFDEPSFSWTFNVETVARKLMQKTESLVQSLQRLATLGYLTINLEAGSLFDCTLKLPSPGLLALKKAPKRPECNLTPTPPPRPLTIVKFGPPEVVFVGKPKQKSLWRFFQLWKLKITPV